MAHYPQFSTLDFLLIFAIFYTRTKGEIRCRMTSLFPNLNPVPVSSVSPSSPPKTKPVDEGHNVEYITIENRSLW
jgi:hypothetical protein